MGARGAEEEETKLCENKSRKVAFNWVLETVGLQKEKIMASLQKQSM